MQKGPISPEFATYGSKSYPAAVRPVRCFNALAADPVTGLSQNAAINTIKDWEGDNYDCRVRRNPRSMPDNEQEQTYRPLVLTRRSLVSTKRNSVPDVLTE